MRRFFWIMFAGLISFSALSTAPPTAHAQDAPSDTSFIPSRSDDDSKVEAKTEKPPLPEGRFIAGGLTGTFIGYGLGHAIVGEWTSMGWVFTVLETALLAATVVGVVTWVRDGVRVADGELDTVPARGPLLTFGSTGLRWGVRIWEAVDVWARPEDRVVKKNSGSWSMRGGAAPYGPPPPSAGMIGVTIRF